MRCPQCGAETPEEAWNCMSCRINLYWARRHFDGLADIRERQGRTAAAQSPEFLRRSHQEAMEDRAARGGLAAGRTRAAARRAMRRSSPPPEPPPA